MRHARSLLATIITLVGASLFSTSTARADNDCPPGSIQMSEDGFTWCQPSVCSNEVPCKANEVCRPIALCMEIGSLSAAGARDGGKRLVVTQRCVAGELPGDPKTCPQKQTCSDMNRCVSKAVAEKLGLLDVPGSPSAKPSAGPTSGEAKKSSCGCDVVGASQGRSGALAFGLAISLLAARRRRRSVPATT